MKSSLIAVLVVNLKSKSLLTDRNTALLVFPVQIPNLVFLQKLCV